MEILVRRRTLGDKWLSIDFEGIRPSSPWCTFCQLRRAGFLGHLWNFEGLYRSSTMQLRDKWLCPSLLVASVRVSHVSPLFNFSSMISLSRSGWEQSIRGSCTKRRSDIALSRIVVCRRCCFFSGNVDDLKRSFMSFRAMGEPLGNGMWSQEMRNYASLPSTGHGYNGSIAEWGTLVAARPTVPLTKQYRYLWA